MQYLKNENNILQNVLKGTRNKASIFWKNKNLWGKKVYFGIIISIDKKGAIGHSLGYWFQKTTIKTDKTCLQTRTNETYEKSLVKWFKTLEIFCKSAVETAWFKTKESQLYFNKIQRALWFWELDARAQVYNGKISTQETKKIRSHPSYQSQQGRQSSFKLEIDAFIRTQKTSFERQLIQTLGLS
jgi:hypothetical protein